MDDKEKLMLEHYKKIIENREFDEYDILGFLIFIRNKITKTDYPYIYEFSDLIAHRHRNQGLIFTNIKNAIDTNYECKKNSNTIKKYKGIGRNRWNSQWRKLGNNFHILISNDLIKEITVCIFSLAQKTEYESKNSNLGKIELAIDSKNNLCMVTTEKNRNSIYVCVAKCGKFNIQTKFPLGIVTEVTETIRKNRKLILKCGTSTILEI